MSDTEATAGNLDLATASKADAEARLATVVSSLQGEPEQEPSLEKPEPQEEDSEVEVEAEGEQEEPDVLDELFGEESESEDAPEGEESVPVSMEDFARLKVTLPDGTEGTGQDMYRGWMSQKHFTQGSQEVAEQKKQLQKFAQQMAAFPQFIMQQAQPFMDQFKDKSVTDLAKLAQDDPQAFARYETGKRELDAISQALDQATQFASEQYDQMTQQRLQATAQVMAKRVKEWSPEYVQNELLPGLMREYQIPPPAFFDYVNPSVAEMAMDALAFRKLKRKAEGIRGRKRKPPQDKIPAKPARRDNPTEEARRVKALKQAAMSDDSGTKKRAVEDLLARQLDKSKLFQR